MNIALILAAGSGTRMNNELPKQFVLVNNKPLFLYSVETFQNNPNIDAIIIATNETYLEETKAYVHSFNKVKTVIIGGASRQGSVYNGLQEIAKFASNDDIVLIHDSARPLVTDRIINDNIKVCEQYDAAGTVIPASDTIIQSFDEKTIGEILNRQELYQAQTPQTFRFNVIKDAHEEAHINSIPNVTDDCRLVKYFGKNVYFVKGDKLNFKVTTPEDLEMLKALIK